ncbi:MAG: L,D-transpeptidase [Candidatus Promineifilaceae bacterium]|nr:L,D-transpeptidase [Candidatus Promineifilaceae bacterium]
MTKRKDSSEEALSRRDFLKLSGIGMLGAVLPETGAPRSMPSGQQGRVINPSIQVFDIPSYNGKPIRLYWKDALLGITGVTIGDLLPEHNRVWYEINGIGYAHSGSIQPVRTILNEPRADLPAQGALAEVTVPFTDAHTGANRAEDVAYRYYYETTHWVSGVLKGREDDLWYRIVDDKWDEREYFVPARHLRIVPKDELNPISPDVPLRAKRLEVDIRAQTVTAYEWEMPVFTTRAATGAEFSNGKFYTPTGRHMTFHKRPSRHMARGNLAANGFDLPGVPWVCYFTESGVAFHGTYWHNDYGRPRSHGCINLTAQSAKWIYRWTLPYVPPEEQRLYENFGTILDVTA